MRRLVWGFAGRACHVVGNLMSRLIYDLSKQCFNFCMQVSCCNVGPAKDVSHLDLDCLTILLVLISVQTA